MIPVETILAVFPKRSRVGNLALGPFTLCHATAMEALGITIGPAIDEDHAMIAAWILSMSPADVFYTMAEIDVGSRDFAMWSKEVDVPIGELTEAVNEIIQAAMAVNVPGAPKDGASVVSGPKGYGWELELGEAVAHEYSMTLEAAMSIPMSRIFGMLACCRQRHGGKAGGPDYYERILLKNIDAIRRQVNDE